MTLLAKCDAEIALKDDWKVKVAEMRTKVSKAKLRNKAKAKRIFG